MRKQYLATTLIGLAAAASLVAPATVSAQPSTKPAPQCFHSSDWDGGWKATPDSKAIYIRVGINNIYRLDLTAPCPMLQSPMSHLITEQRGGASICSAVDLDLKVSDGHGFSTACIVKELTPLSPAEASAIPRSERP